MKSQRIDRRLLFWLRKNLPLFREERLFGAALILARALIQLSVLLATEPSRRSLAKAGQCLRAIPHHTMIAPRLLYRMMDLATAVHLHAVEGAVVECGVWNGGSLALLSVAAGGRREGWGFDSFQGVPPPSSKDPKIVSDFYYKGWNLGSIAKVEEAWLRFNLPLSNLRIVPGWFEETFPRTEIEKIAILHIDSDWHQSVKACLDRWYDHVQPGGVTIVNDYDQYSGANRAVEEFFADRPSLPAIRPLATVGAYFYKDMR